ncbi:MAG: hypothetical protein JXR88_09345 [Clostridia bacterium]|nr:hypothetical protein [Clostridia bacterium]
MKKFLLMTMTTILAFSMVACGSQNDSATNSQTKSDATQTESQETEKFQTYMGLVKDKLGNELTVSLGKLIIENDNGDGQGMMIDENGNQVPIDGDMGNDAGGQTIMIPVPDDNSGDENSTDGNEIEKLPIEFTGEVRAFTIPAGAKIVNAMGKETTLDSIKNGSLIQIIMNETKGTINSIIVW